MMTQCPVRFLVETSGPIDVLRTVLLPEMAGPRG